MDLVNQLRQRTDYLSRDAADEIERLKRALREIRDGQEQDGIGIAERALREGRPLIKSWGND